MSNYVPYDEWFENPLDSMPIATDKSIERNNPQEEIADWFTDKPKEEDKTMHEKMYEIATARYNPFSLGGSENCDSDISCNIGGSENASSI